MFSFKHFVRTVPARTLRPFLESRQFAAVGQIDWSAEESELAKAVIAAIESADPATHDHIVSDMQEASQLADEAGERAIRNVSPAGANVVPLFAALDNAAERALALYYTQPNVFEDALEVRFFDDRSGNPSAKRFDLKHKGSVSRAAKDCRALAAEIAAFYREKEGCGNSCEVEILDRRLEGAVQVTVYVEDLANSRPEFEHGALKRRRSHPAKEVALVYTPATGIADTVARGGPEYHDELVVAFAKHLLGVTIKPDTVKPQIYKLLALKKGVAVPNQAKYGIDSIRLKSLTFVPLDGAGGYLSIEAPGRGGGLCASEWLDRYLPTDNPMRQPFTIVQAAIAVRFLPEDGKKRARSLTLKFTRSGLSNLQQFSEADRSMLQGFMVHWGLIDGPNSSQPPAAPQNDHAYDEAA